MGKFITHFISSLLILCCIGTSQAWASCDYTFNQDVYTTSIHNGEVIYQASFNNTYTYGLKTLTFKLTLTCTAAGKDLSYKVQYLPQNSNTWTDSNIKTSTLDGTWQAWRSESSETITHSPTTSDPIYNARGIRVVSTTNFGKSWGKEVYRDVKITDVAFEKGTTFSVSTNALEAFPATVINTTSTTTRSFTINYSNVENLFCTTDNSEFTISSLSGDLCTGPQTVVVSFTPNSACPTTRTATITVTAGSQVQTISVSGEALLMTPTLNVNSDIQSVDLYSTTFPGNKLDLSTLITNHVGGTLVYAVTGATNGGAVSEAILDGSIFYATHSGDYQVTVTSEEDCSYSSAVATLNIHVNDKVQPSFVLNGDETLEEAYLNVETNTASIALTNVDASTFNMTYDHNVLACQLESNVIVVTAKQIGEPTLTLEQPETPNTYSASRTFTFHITKNTATLTNNLAAEYLVDDEIAFADLYTATNDEVAVTVLSSDETVLKADGDKLVAVGAGTAEITVSQAENYKWTALSETKSVTVSKHANTIVWSFGDEITFSKTLGFDSGIYVDYHSDNEDNIGSPFTIKPTSGADIATYYENQKAIYTSHTIGTATWTISQPEDRKYLAAEAIITVTVAPMTANCYAIEDAEQHSIGYYDNKDGFEYTLNGSGETLSIDIWKYSGATYGTVAIYGYDANGNQTTIASYKADGDLSTSPKTMTLGINSDIVKIKVTSEGDIFSNALNKYFKNLYITRKQLLVPSSEAITLPTISLGNRSTQSFNLQWSTCADAIKLVSSNPHFTLDKTEIAATSGAGTETITITYSSSVLEENATSTITIYTPYQNITLTAMGTTERKKQALSWAEEWQQDNPTIRIGETVTNAVTTSAEDGRLPIYYYSDNEEIIKVSDDHRSFTAVGVGSATITAKQDGDKEWAPASVQKTFTVTAKRLQYIVWEQDFSRLKSKNIGQAIPLTAKVQVLNDNGEFVDAEGRTIVYSVGDENVVKIVENNQLYIVGKGETTITASVDGDDTYEAAILTMRVGVLSTSGCDDPLVASYEGTIKILGKAIFDDVPMDEDPIVIEHTNGFPDKVEFQYWGEKWTLAVSYFKGNLRVEQSTDNKNTWTTVATMVPEQDNIQTDVLPLDPNVTHIRFVCPKGGQGYQCVKNIRVLPQQFVKVVSIDGSANTEETPTINFGTLGVGSKETKTFALSYSNIKSSLSLTTNTEELALSCNTMGSCGDWKRESTPITITFIPKQAGPFDGTITIYDAESNLQTSIRITANVSESQQFVFSKPGEWGSAENWNKGSVPGKDDVVSIGADVDIIGDVTVAGMTIYSGNTVNVKVNGKLTIGDQPSAEQEHYGNLVIENGGEVVLGAGVLKVNDFIINASTGSLSDQQPLSGSTYAPATSGQLIGQNITCENAYIDLFFCDIHKTDQWHAMTVPFYVDVRNGVFTTDNRPLKEGVDYTFAEYNSDNRAAGKRGWQMLRGGELVPGNFYCFSGSGYIQTFRFKQISGKTLFFGKEKILTAYATSTTTKGNKGWNAVGNPTLCHGTVDFMVQTLEPTYTYAVHQANSTVFPVGVAFFIQTDEDRTMIMKEATVPNKLRAKEEQWQQDISMCIRLSDSTYTDKLYVSASEDALDEYEIGKDLVKMAMTNAPCVPQISAPFYKSNMCAVYCPFTNDEVAVPLTLYAPSAGQYSLSVQCDDQVDVYLVQNNTLIWNLSAGAYDIDLAKGNTQDYKVVIRPKQQTPTGVRAAPITQDSGVEKVILNQHLYVLKNGRVYDATGRLIK